VIKNRNLIFNKANDASPEEDRGLRLPQISNTSLPADTTDYEGMIAYDATNNKLVVQTGSGWETVTSS